MKTASNDMKERKQRKNRNYLLHSMTLAYDLQAIGSKMCQFANQFAICDLLPNVTMCVSSIRLPLQANES